MYANVLIPHEKRGELFPFDKITLKSHIFVLLLPSWASSVVVKQC